MHPGGGDGSGVLLSWLGPFQQVLEGDQTAPLCSDTPVSHHPSQQRDNDQIGGKDPDLV